MSNEIAQPFAFHREHDGSLSLESAVFQALGAASTCWDSLLHAGVFHSDRAKEIGETLLEFINLSTVASGPRARGDSLDADEATRAVKELVALLTRPAELFEQVAHAAWHLMDDSGEDEDDDGLRIHSALDGDRLSAALDALEASGWTPHPEDHE